MDLKLLKRNDLFMFESLSDFINEGFTLSNNKIIFTPNENNDVIDTTMIPKKENLSVLNNKKLVLHYCYKIKDKNTINLNSADIQRALKKDKGRLHDIEEESYISFIRRTAILLSKKIEESKIETLLVIESSSNLNSDLLDIVKSKLPHLNIFKISKVKGSEVSQISLDIDKIPTSMLDKQLSILNNIHSTGEMKIKKFLASMRKHVLNWLKLDDFNYTKYLDNKKIGIFDDFYTSGSTFIEAARILQVITNEEQVHCFSIMKS